MGKEVNASGRRPCEATQARWKQNKCGTKQTQALDGTLFFKKLQEIGGRFFLAINNFLWAFAAVFLG